LRPGTCCRSFGSNGDRSRVAMGPRLPYLSRRSGQLLPRSVAQQRTATMRICCPLVGRCITGLRRARR
jgi:hypothetical protein